MSNLARFTHREQLTFPIEEAQPNMHVLDAEWVSEPDEAGLARRKLPSSPHTHGSFAGTLAAVLVLPFVIFWDIGVHSLGTFKDVFAASPRKQARPTPR